MLEVFTMTINYRWSEPARKKLWEDFPLSISSSHNLPWGSSLKMWLGAILGFRWDGEEWVFPQVHTMKTMLTTNKLLFERSTLVKARKQTYQCYFLSKLRKLSIYKFPLYLHQYSLVKFLNVPTLSIHLTLYQSCLCPRIDMKASWYICRW